MKNTAHALGCAGQPVRLLFLGWDADTDKEWALPIMKCESCRLVFTNSSANPDIAEDELYADGYYGERASERLLNRIMIGIFQAERQWLTIRDMQPGRVLDIGCGDGTYLRNLPNEWDRFGYEPSLPGQKQLELHGIAVHDLSKTSDERFDLVTMWQTFEHVDDPRDLLEAVKGRLNSGGQLFVSVPNFGSLQARIFRGNWFHLDPTRHRYHFTKKTLGRLLEEQGFQIRSTTTASFEYGVYGWWQSLLNLLPIEFNMAYKLLKARKKFKKDTRYYASLGLQALVGAPLLIVAGMMTVLETMIAMGGVIQCTARLEVKNKKHHLVHRT